MGKTKQLTPVFRIRGEASSRKVWIDEKELDPKESQAVYNHSPNGFAWGYNGSGPAQLALAICLKVYGKEKALEIYQEFKQVFIAPLQIDQDFDIDIHG